jgi:hypothetical protein
MTQELRKPRADLDVGRLTKLVHDVEKTLGSPLGGGRE